MAKNITSKGKDWPRFGLGVGGDGPWGQKRFEDKKKKGGKLEVQK